jgi:hypothetical protein
VSDREDAPAAKLYSETHGTNTDEFRTLVLEAAELANTIAVLKSDFEDKKKQLEPFLKNAGLSAVLVPENDETYAMDPKQAPVVRVTLVKGKKSRKLSVEKLIKLGVKEATILASTTETTGEPYVKISTRVSDEEEAA